MERRNNTGAFKVDVHELRRLIREQDTISHAGVMCGYCSTYFSVVFNGGVISEAGADALEDVYGIKPEQYRYRRKKAEPRKESPCGGLSEQQRTITSGIVEAVRYLALTGELNEALVKAVKQALSEYFEEDESDAE